LKLKDGIILPDEAGKFMHFIDLEDNVKAVAIPVSEVEVEKSDVFMASLRSKMPNVILQAINAKFVVNIAHLWAIVKQSWVSNKKGISKVKFDLDILLRISCSSNLGSALDVVGLKSGSQDVIFVGIGLTKHLQSINNIILSQGKPSNDLLLDNPEKTNFLKKYHKINDLSLASVMVEQGQLVALLVEKAAIIVPGRH
jgi:tRNA threonylcarbamoyladenosine modification (KEOPS) complex Cgi121 subunit